MDDLIYKIKEIIIKEHNNGYYFWNKNDGEFFQFRFKIIDNEIEDFIYELKNSHNLGWTSIKQIGTENLEDFDYYSTKILDSDDIRHEIIEDHIKNQINFKH
jgi:hypothetical protein